MRHCMKSLDRQHVLFPYFGLPKVHKNNIPPRPIVSSIIGSVWIARSVSDPLSPFNSRKIAAPYTKLTEIFASIKDLKLDDNESLTSYDVTALFTSVPVDGALEVVKEPLQKDNSQKSRTCLNSSQIIILLEFCLTTTYFMFRGQYTNKKMKLPGSSIIANLYMENFEVKAINRASHHACLDAICWRHFRRY